MTFPLFPRNSWLLFASLGIILKYMKSRLFQKSIQIFALLSASAFWVCCSDDNSSNASDNNYVESSSSDSTGIVIPESSSSDAEIEVPESSSSTSSAEDTLWNRAKLTWYESYPDPDSEECIEYNGCTWAGWFAGLEDQQTEEWVSEHNIIAVHEKDWDTYKLKTFRLRRNGYTIDAVVYDMCSDSDCDGCCTKNAGSVGFLIDIEKYTRARFNNYGSGTVEWTCLDCD